MQIYGISQDPSEKQVYLAKHQDTKYAVISVHTAEEKILFKDLMQKSPDSSIANWDALVKIWNGDYANGTTVFYKVSFKGITEPIYY